MSEFFAHHCIFVKNQDAALPGVPDGVEQAQGDQAGDNFR